MRPATFGAAAVFTSRMTIDRSLGVVTQTSFVRATNATPSGIEGRVAQPRRSRVVAFTAHTLESARSPTYTTPSPTVAELGPTWRFLPPRFPFPDREFPDRTVRLVR